VFFSFSTGSLGLEYTVPRSFQQGQKMSITKGPAGTLMTAYGPDVLSSYAAGKK